MIDLIKSALYKQDQVLKNTIKCKHNHYKNKDSNTIHINTGRRTGKTTSIFKLARESDLIVVHSLYYKYNLMSNFRNNLAKITTPEDLIKDIKYIYPYNMVPPSTMYIKKFKYNYIWIDEPYLCEHTFNRYFKDSNFNLLVPNFLDTIYNYFDADKFILLGE
jgi:hypothetical protein